MKIATAAAAATLFLSGCSTLGIGGGGGKTLSNSPSQPAAEGTVRCGAAKNDNTSISVKVKHVAHPQKLNPPATTYVVWTRKDNGSAPQNMGDLKVDKNLTGTLDTVTALRSFDLLITAENNPQADKPSGQPQLWTSCSR